MPITGMPDPALHRICRRCQRWFEPTEGALQAPEVTGPLGAMQALRAASGDRSVMRFQCARCTKVRRNTQLVLWGTLLLLVAIILLAERFALLQ